MQDEFNPFAKPGKVLDLSHVKPLGKFTIRGLKPGLMRQMEALGAQIEDVDEDVSAEASTLASVDAVCKSIEIALIGGGGAKVAEVLAAAWADDADETVTFGGLMDALAFVQSALGIEEVEAPNG